MKNLFKLTPNRMIAAAFFFSLFFVGLFHEYAACLFSALLSALFLFLLRKEKHLIIHKNITSISIVAITAAYGLTTLWAIDSGMGFIGFLKFLPLLPFLLLLMHKPDVKEKLIDSLPYAMAIMTLVSAIGSFIPGLEAFFLVADRLAGFLQYPNTFALLLLVSELILLSKKKLSFLNVGTVLVLLLGIVYSGSRTVFALALVANIAFGLFAQNKKARIFTLAGIGLAAVSVVIFALISDSNVLDRFLRFSLTESTFAGRFLYFRDALPVILKHPFGLGFMGYYYLQQTIQTGVYSTAYVHNDILQLMLDVGWIPAILLIVAIFKTIFHRDTTMGRKIILATIFLHCCFDFDLQFVSVFFVLILFLEPTAGKPVRIKKALPFNITAVALSVISLYMGVALFLPRVGQMEASRVMYPWYTRNNIDLLAQTEDLEEGNAFADEILAQNEYVTLAYSMKSHYAYSQGNFTDLIRYKNEIFTRFPFQFPEYEEYCQMLINGISLYQQAGDPRSASACIKELRATRDKVEALADRLSPLGKIIVDQPTTSLPDDLNAYIDSIH